MNVCFYCERVMSVEVRGMVVVYADGLLGDYI